MNSEVGILGSLMRNRLLAVAIVLLCVLGAVVASTQRPTQHTADARLLVGGLDIRVDAIPGMVAASNNLAASYSRVASTVGVLEPAAKSLGVSVVDVRRSVSVSPTVESPVIVVRAEMKSKDDAPRYAAAVADSLANYINNTGPGSGATILDEYMTTSSDLNRLKAEQARLAREQSPLAGPKQTEVDATQLRVNALAQNYAAASAKGYGARVIDAARLTGDNRNATLQTFGFAGLLIGLLLATSASVWREERKHSRLRKLSVTDVTNSAHAQTESDVQHMSLSR